MDQNQIDDYREMLDWIEQHPELQFTLPPPRKWFFGKEGKQPFLDTVKAFGDCEKDFSSEREIKVIKRFGTNHIEIEIARSVICEKVTVMKAVEEWQCPSLLSEAEMSELKNS